MKKQITTLLIVLAMGLGTACQSMGGVNQDLIVHSEGALPINLFAVPGAIREHRKAVAEKERKELENKTSQTLAEVKDVKDVKNENEANYE